MNQVIDVQATEVNAAQPSESFNFGRKFGLALLLDSDFVQGFKASRDPEVVAVAKEVNQHRFNQHKAALLAELRAMK